MNAADGPLCNIESCCRLQGGGPAVQYADPSRIVGAVKEGTRSAVGFQRRYGRLLLTGIELPELV